MRSMLKNKKDVEVTDLSDIMLQFGKVGENDFHLDFKEHDTISSIRAHACTVQFRILIVFFSFIAVHDTAHHEFSVVDIFGSSLDSQ